MGNPLEGEGVLQSYFPVPSCPAGCRLAGVSRGVPEHAAVPAPVARGDGRGGDGGRDGDGDGGRDGDGARDGDGDGARDGD